LPTDTKSDSSNSDISANELHTNQKIEALIDVNLDLKILDNSVLDQTHRFVYTPKDGTVQIEDSEFYV
jgi:hypothetical protein